MKLLAASSLGLLLAFLPVDADLAFAPQQGLTVNKSFTFEFEAELEEITVTLDWEEIPPEMMPKVEMLQEWSSTLVVEDTYGASLEGNLLRLERAFIDVNSSEVEEISLDGEALVERDEERTSPVVDEAVVFEWEGGEYLAKSEDDAVEESVLEGLGFDLDMLSFLPDEPAAEGDDWDLTEESFAALFPLGGDLAWDPAPLGHKEEPSLTAEGKAEFVEVVERDGRRLARITLEAELTYKVVTEGDLEFIPVTDGTATQTTVQSIELEGELFWDLAGGHAASMKLGGPVSMESSLLKDPDQGDGDFEAISILAGTWKFEAEFERSE